MGKAHCKILGLTCHCQSEEELHSPTPVRLTIVSADGPLCTIDADHSWKVCDVKFAIERKAGIPIAQQKLATSRLVFQDHEPLSSVIPGKCNAVDVCFTRIMDAPSWLKQSHRDPWALRTAPKEAVMGVLELDGLQLQCLSYEYRADPDIVLKAVQQNGLALLYAAKELKVNRHIVTAAIRTNREAIAFVGSELKSDLSFLKSLRGGKNSTSASIRSSHDLEAHSFFSPQKGQPVSPESQMSNVAEPPFLTDSNLMDRSQMESNFLDPPLLTDTPRGFPKPPQPSPGARLPNGISHSHPFHAR